MALKITDIVFEALSGLYLDCEEVVDVLLELSLESTLVIESMLHLFEAPESLSRECIEPFIGSALETKWEHATQEQLVIRVDCHLVLVLPEILDGIGRPRVVLED